jgi:hypothetical protein
MNIRMEGGATSGTANINPVAVVMHTKGNASCNNKSQKIVLAPAARGWTWGICSRAWPPKVWRCKWKWSTPEISFRYHIQLAIRFANINAVLTNPRIYLLPNGKQNICNAGAIAMTPGPIIGGYSPQIDTHLPEADRIVNAILAASFEAPQSLLATSIVTSASWLVSGVGSIAPELCLGEN